MADTFQTEAVVSAGVTFASDDVAGTHYPIAKLAHGALDSATLVTTSSGLPVQQQGTFTVDLGATDNAVLDNIDTDLTTIIGHVDGLEALLTTIDADTSTLAGAVSGTEMQADVVTFPTTVHSADYDTGAGTDTTLAFGIAVPAAGGAAVVPGDATAGLKVDLGADNDVTVTGTVTANLSATDNAVLDNIDADLTTIIGHVDGLEALLTTIDADTSNLSVVGGGTEAAAIRVTIANNSTGVLSVDDNGGSLTIDNAGITTIAGAVSGTEMQVDVVGALPAGTNAIGKLAANSGVDIGDVDVTSIAAGTNNIGNVGVIPRTSGGMTIFRSIDLDETEEEVKATPGQVFSISAFNTTAAPLYLKFYNLTAANTTVGTSTPVLTFVVPGNADSDGAGFIWNNDIGFAFGTAITVACTTGVSDADTGAPGANACIVNIGYA